MWNDIPLIELSLCAIGTSTEDAAKENNPPLKSLTASNEPGEDEALAQKDGGGVDPEEDEALVFRAKKTKKRKRKRDISTEASSCEFPFWSCGSGCFTFFV